jgi:hypothetical protein
MRNFFIGQYVVIIGTLFSLGVAKWLDVPNVSVGASKILQNFKNLITHYGEESVIFMAKLPPQPSRYG